MLDGLLKVKLCSPGDAFYSTYWSSHSPKGELVEKGSTVCDTLVAP